MPAQCTQFSSIPPWAVACGGSRAELFTGSGGALSLCLEPHNLSLISERNRGSDWSSFQVYNQAGSWCFYKINAAAVPIAEDFRRSVRHRAGKKTKRFISATKLVLLRGLITVYKVSVFIVYGWRAAEGCIEGAAGEL
jgi:hypothetical protein